MFCAICGTFTVPWSAGSDGLFRQPQARRRWKRRSVTVTANERLAAIVCLKVRCRVSVPAARSSSGIGERTRARGREHDRASSPIVLCLAVYVALAMQLFRPLRGVSEMAREPSKTERETGTVTLVNATVPVKAKRYVRIPGQRGSAGRPADLEEPGTARLGSEPSPLSDAERAHFPGEHGAALMDGMHERAVRALIGPGESHRATTSPGARGSISPPSLVLFR